MVHLKQLLIQKFSTSIKKLLLFLIGILCLFNPQKSLALHPIAANIAFVAGAGTAGFKDGSFTSALFHTPLGLAVSDDGTCIFVADSGNNRIRIIHIDRNNDVTTLTGQDLPGKLDGSLANAQFNHPSGIIYLPDDRLIINDFGNHLFRLVDLKAGTVTTLAGGGTTPTGSVTLLDGPAAQVMMNGVRDMAYMPAADSIFFTQPEMNSLKRLNLKTGMVSMVINHSSQIDHPAALWSQGTNLYVADLEQPNVFEINWKENTVASPISITSPIANVLSMAWNGNILYALLGNPTIPLEQLAPYSQPVSLKSPWGDTIWQPGNSFYPFRDLTVASPVGFKPDPLDSRKFYVANPQYNMVFAFRDLYGDVYAGGDDRNSNGLNEPEYPLQKPKNTYRILFVGDSRSTMMVNYPFPTDFNSQFHERYPRILSISKQIERELNTQAALDNINFNFEVLNLSHSASEPLFLWPVYEVPEIVKRNDIDLVIIFVPPTPEPQFPYTAYFDAPISQDGIPKYPYDMEYLLKPPLERIVKGVPQSFYELCKKKGYVKTEGNNFNFDEKLFLDPELHDMLVQLYGRPFDILNQKISSMKTSSGQSVRLLLCSAHTGIFRPNLEDPQIWVDAAKKYNYPLLDINEEVTALGLSFFPLAEEGNNHLNPDGHAFFGRLLAHDLIRNQVIPWK